ncbi:flavin-containing monooxygenase [Gordonia sp. SL306]|uniref:flavin-containing monooxygenase n=1 Tax=Gordonia sp. SL306 TaxID=2995145 RepID=UPI002271095A|nr:NAD(P)/FAD-dependent oxidoreductase [Gordonia sp. SL306]WAC54304.1 NAD(P)/FAD-dependent oxidoreductase [Gordonia sp. SL306]
MPEHPERPEPTEDVDVLVVGTGFGGLAAVHRLRTDHPRLTIRVIERAAGPGGVWRDNDYPGAACDVPTSLYSLSFADNPEWSHTYGRQHEIRRYLEAVARDHADVIRYNCPLTAAAWDGDTAHWIAETGLGTIRARHLVAASGALSEPGVPDLPGSDRFGGTVFHTARWRHDHDLTGRHVAIVGSGASAVQVVPEIVDRVAHLTVFQRTPAWVVPRMDRTIGPVERSAYRTLPISHTLIRRLTYLYREAYVVMMARRPRLLPAATALAKAHLRLQVRDRGLRRRLTPDYTIGCKRMLLTNKWFPALQRDNVTLTGAISRLADGAAVDADGTEHRVDTVIFATGFTPTTPPIARILRGRDGRTLAEAWAGSPSAYRGVSVHGFPNLHLMYGPNTNLGHSSIVLMLEPQAYYISAVLEHLRTQGRSAVEVTGDAQRRYAARMDSELAGTVWNSGGCSSWYMDSSGRNSVMWPTFTKDYRKMMSQFDPADHLITGTSSSTADITPRFPDTVGVVR